MQPAAKDWTSNQRKFMAWLAVPSAMRKPRFQSDFAKQIGVVESTLWRWKKEPGFAEEVARLSRALLKDDLPDIFGALISMAKAGSYQHIKLALEVAGEHTDEVNVNVGDARRELMHKLGVPDELAARRGASRAS